MLGFVDAWLAKLGARREYTERQEYDRVIGALRSAMGDRLASAMAHGADWTEAAFDLELFAPSASAEITLRRLAWRVSASRYPHHASAPRLSIHAQSTPRTRPPYGPSATGELRGPNVRSP
jgi:hypothetical protein